MNKDRLCGATITERGINLKLLKYKDYYGSIDVSVDDYLEMCKELAYQPELSYKMSY